MLRNNKSINMKESIKVVKNACMYVNVNFCLILLNAFD